MSSRRRGIGGPAAAFVFALILLTAGALVLRLPSLGIRPMHADEAVHALKFRDLWEKGAYTYDPDEFHGPTLYYAALPVVALRGRHDFAQTQEADYRAAIALFGAGMLLLLALLTDALGRRAVLIAALFLAVSPAFVFYSRYYIQETLLAFFTLWALACGWRYMRRPSPGWALGVGVGAGLMVATKETAVLSFAAAIGAFILTCLSVRRAVRFKARAIDVAAALAIGAFVACLFVSGLFHNPHAIADYFRSYTPWLYRAGGTDLHRHAWTYYLEILVWPFHGKGRTGPVFTEAFLIALACLGTAVAFRRRDLLPPGSSPAFIRFVAFYTLILTVIYSAIPYKTPWCVLGFLTGIVILAGVGAAVLRDRASTRTGKLVATAALALGTGQLGFQAYRASYVYFADGRNPYAYSPTAPEAVTLGQRVGALADVSSDGDRTVVKVFSADGYYWPLPWYLRRFPNVGYWTGKVPSDAAAPVIIASPEFDDDLGRRLDNTHIMAGYYGLRPGALYEMWVRTDLWQAYLKKRGPESDE